VVPPDLRVACADFGHHIYEGTPLWIR
jgi:hypothetical protein